MYNYVSSPVIFLVLILAGEMKISAQPSSYTLNPPADLQLEAVECVTYATWDKPDPGTSPGLIGYRIYRDGTYLTCISDQDTTWFYDFSVIPGFHDYSVSALYELTPYGYPGYFDESAPKGPAWITIICCCPLPFLEDWDGGSFSYNDWMIFPSPGNWSISVTTGHPLPSAVFSGLPADTNYSYILTRGKFDASAWYCATFQISYDIMLDDLNGTGAEKFAVELLYDGTWHQMDLFSNAGSFPWEHHQHEIPDAGGGYIEYRFRAFGVNSPDITGWYLDNILIQSACHPPLLPEGMVSEDGITLTWHPPDCSQGSSPLWIEEEVFCHDGNPQVASVQSFDWVYGSIFDLSAVQYQVFLLSLDFHQSSMGLNGIWKYRVHIVDWFTHQELATLGPFFTSGDDRWELDIPLDSIGDINGGMIGIFIQPMGNTPDNAYPRITSDNSGPQGTSLFGTFPDYQTLSPLTTGDYLINLHILIPDTTTDNVSGVPDFALADQESVEYSIWRSADSLTGFVILNQDPIPDTSFVDTEFPPGASVLYYFIEASFEVCSSRSDTLEILMTTVKDILSTDLSIFPNPAFVELQVVSPFAVTGWYFMDPWGRKWKHGLTGGSQSFSINISDIPGGIYFLVMDTERGRLSRKVTVLAE